MKARAKLSPMSVPLPSRVLNWIERALPKRTLSHVHRLPGSTSASVYRLDFADSFSAVLRQFDLKPDWLRSEPDLARHEARSLERAEQSELPTPELIAYDETGAEAGCPSVLMTCLPGSVEINPPDFPAWLDQMAAALARVHRVSPADFGWQYAFYTDLNTLQIPTWSGVPQAWARAIELVRGPRPAFTPRFIHRDFHPVNVLWLGGHISGVVDWVNACQGPVGADVAHCRVNLAQMYGVQAADAFLDAYAQRTGHVQDRYWDALGLLDFTGVIPVPGVYPGWPAFGLTGLTDELIRERLDDYLTSLLNPNGQSA